MVNALTIDVEEYFQVEAFARVIAKKDWDKFVSRVIQNTEKILNLLEFFQIKATFFCLGWVAERYPELIKAIAQKGHEIASHGFSHTPIFRLTPQEFRKEVRKSKRLLEDLSDREVKGFRAPTYSVTKNTLWALKILAEEGYTYDSSIFPIRHDLYGLPEAPRFPFKIKSLGLIEFPITTARFLGIKWPAAGGGYFRLFPYPLTKYLLKRINRKEKMPFIFYVHPWEFDPAQPRIKAPLKSRFRHYLNLKKTEKRFKKLLFDFKFAPVEEVLKTLPLLPGIEL